MIKDFYIFRHGETDCNKEHRWQGCGIDSELNAVGLEQARGLVPRLQPCALQIIYSSPLQRALKTAQIAAESLQIPVEIIPDLREGCFGAAEGMLKTEIAAAFPQIYADWYGEADDLDVGFPGGETKRQMQQRMLGVLQALLKQPFTSIGIASHGSSIRYLLMAFGRQPHRMPNTALYHLRFAHDNWQLL